MRRLLAVVTALVAVLLFIPATPATALNAGGPACAGKSGFNYDVRVCAIWGWRLQNDGSGIHVENVNIYTSKGCGDLESQAFSNVYAMSLDTEQRRDIGDQHSCNVTWDLEQNGKDVGAGQFLAHAHVRVDNASDFDVNLVCTIWPNQPDACYGEAYN